MKLLDFLKRKPKTSLPAPMYEIDVTKKYILAVPGHLSAKEREHIMAEIKRWIEDDTRPFLLVNGDAVRLVKVEE